MNPRPTSIPRPARPADAPRRARPRRRGVTLVEVAVLLLVLTLAGPALLLALRDAGTDRLTTAHRAVARWLAQERLEDILADAASPTRGFTFVATANYPDESPVAGFPAFTRRVTITPTGPALSGPANGFKTARVAVGYLDGRGRRVDFILATVLAEPLP